MSKNEQTVKALKDMMDRLRAERAAYNQEVDNKIAGLEIAYEALTGEKAPTATTVLAKAPSAPRVTRMRAGRRGMKIDRQGKAKTYAFMMDRGTKATSVKMVARRFNISEEAASQRMLNIYSEGSSVRVAKGQYVLKEFAPVVTNGANGSAHSTAKEAPEG